MRPNPAFARAWLTPCLLVSLHAQPVLAQPAPDVSRVTRAVDSIGRAALRSGRVTGLSIGVAMPAQPLLIRYFGRSADRAQSPLGNASVSRIASITKQFTAAAIVRLLERGQLSLDSDVRTLLTDWPADRAAVTVRQLLTHTSGVREVRFAGTQRTPVLSQSRTRQDTIAAHILADSSDFAPGSAFRYSNAGYFLLGRIVERVSGGPLKEFWRAEFFQPLGMRQTSDCDDVPPSLNRVIGDERDANGRPTRTSPIRMVDVYAAGAICSTARDLLIWSQAFERGQVVSYSSYARMTDSSTTRGLGAAYGFGFFLGSLTGHPWRAHNGSINGFATRLASYPADSVSVVILANTGGANVTPIERAIARVALGLPDPAPLALPVSRADLTRYAGTYEDREHGLVATITPNGTQLTGTMWQMGRTGLRHQGNGVFALDIDHDFRVTFRGGGAVADRMEVTDGVQGTTLVRRP
jgi:D-alanyl-D-alanine carboxypeptidase